MLDQVLAVKARLMQDDENVGSLSWLAGVNRLTAALVYCACGCRIKRSRTVLNAARMAVRNSRPATGTLHEQRLLEHALALAKRTTPHRHRRRQ